MKRFLGLPALGGVLVLATVPLMLAACQDPPPPPVPGQPMTFQQKFYHDLEVQHELTDHRMR